MLVPLFLHLNLNTFLERSTLVFRILIALLRVSETVNWNISPSLPGETTLSQHFDVSDLFNQSEVDEINPVTQWMHLLESAFNLTGKINLALDEIKQKKKKGGRIVSCWF